MIGDPVDPSAADPDLVAALAGRCQELLEGREGRLRVAIAGESGSGKSTLAAALALRLSELGLTARVLQLDDYFRLPPQANAARRGEDPTWVGPGEVRLELLDAHLDQAADSDRIETPLVDYEADLIRSQSVSLAGVAIVIAEGTYTARLVNADLRVFVVGSDEELCVRRAVRGREAQDAVVLAAIARERELLRRDAERCDLVVGAAQASPGLPKPGKAGGSGSTGGE